MEQGQISLPAKIPDGQLSGETRSHNPCTVQLTTETIEGSEGADKNTFGRGAGGQVISVAAPIQALTHRLTGTDSRCIIWASSDLRRKPDWPSKAPCDTAESGCEPGEVCEGVGEVCRGA
jgi:hypothetical protein